MNKDNYIELIFKKLKGDISLEEQSQLDWWLGQSTENEKLASQIEADWNVSGQYDYHRDIEVDLEIAFESLKEKIAIDTHPKEVPHPPQDNLRIAHQPLGKVVRHSSKKRYIQRLGWAAAAIFLLALGFWFLNEIRFENEIPLLVLETGPDKRQSIQLADGSTVHLNRNSKLEYPVAFDRSLREVRLTGEAFFEVFSNPIQPFTVKTRQSRVTVLGTSFNVRSPLSEMITSVVVREGKVRLENEQGKQVVELVANEKGVYNSENDQFLKTTIKGANDLAWYNGKLVFSNTPVPEVIATIKQLFEVEIKMENELLGDCAWGGIYPVADGAGSILKALAKDFEMSFRQLGNRSFELGGGICK